ncbi:membrane protein [Salinisphaera hydrothermalis]|uniref:Glycine-zipper-containing OmpA-like membrane domain-containing protein n=1 Tax=Salinisphaera hydrothermalis (strain C41B8) TaxID=1304275 RepID=A0A084IM60_SALHC|nr:membrane protein [Salinisphaera hydrothermalis]KEZ77794.1 hypothetical protein C41B8_08260 [Salinisphaera hydrothermalis C41B8]
MWNRRALIVAAVLGLAGCASQKPVLYSRGGGMPPGGHQAVSDCTQQAKAAGLDYSKGRIGRNAVENGAVGGAGGAVAGAIYGNAATGAAAGAAGGVAAGLVRDMFHHDNGPAPAYRAYVNRCLRDRGYQPIGWN